MKWERWGLDSIIRPRINSVSDFYQAGINMARRKRWNWTHAAVLRFWAEICGWCNYGRSAIMRTDVWFNGVAAWMEQYIRSLWGWAGWGKRNGRRNVQETLGVNLMTETALYLLHPMSSYIFIVHFWTCLDLTYQVICRSHMFRPLVSNLSEE